MCRGTKHLYTSINTSYMLSLQVLWYLTATSIYLKSSQSLSDSLSKSLRLGLVILLTLCHTVLSIVILALSSCVQHHRHYLSLSQLSHCNTSALQHSSPSNVADIALCLLSLFGVPEDFIKSLSLLSTPYFEFILLSIKYKECIWIILRPCFTVSLDSIILVIALIT